MGTECGANVDNVERAGLKRGKGLLGSELEGAVIVGVDRERGSGGGGGGEKEEDGGRRRSGDEGGEKIIGVI